MAEPTSSGALGAISWKLLGGLAGVLGIGAALASIVAMCASLPETRREWAVALISTFVASVCGGALVIIKFSLLAGLSSLPDLELFVRLLGILGIVFTCGLPGWFIVRMAFNWMAKRKDKDLGEIVQEARVIIGGGK